MQFEYRTQGTCSSMIHFEIEDGKLTNVEYTGGCNGNLQGIHCGMKPTSCPDQLANALIKAKEHLTNA